MPSTRRRAFCFALPFTAVFTTISSVMVIITRAQPAPAQNAQAQPAPAQNAPLVITVDAAAERHPINPLIYGVANADAKTLADLNAPLNRNGGNNTSRYNWKQNADNRGMDWFFQSIAEESPMPGERGDSFIARSKATGAQPMLTVPMLDWVAKVGPNREKLASFSVEKYGAQAKTDHEWMPDAGNGMKDDKQPITGNDPNDANVPNSPEFQAEWVRHLVKKWGRADAGGLRYYILDNEPALWHETHRDVQPVGVTMQQLLDKTIAYATQIKKADPSALVVGPEEWGWTGYLYSGYDSQQGPKLGWNQGALPDRKANGGQDFLPWYLAQLRRHEKQTGKRLLDIFTVHYYPQGGEFSGKSDDDVSPAMQLRRNRSTRSLWDADYTDETWINEKVQLVPRLKNWVKEHYPGTPVGITEYNWGAESHINGATAQADIYGIFGREGLDMAARWTTPAAATPTFKAMQMYRNYDGKKSGFGQTSVRASVPDPDEVSAFAALRNDGALTIMVVNKQLPGDAPQPAPIQIDLKNFTPKGAAQAWQLTAENKIQRLPDIKADTSKLNIALLSQSITLFVVPA